MNYKNPKGFTLIELLAVIVILAVIALILTPIVSGIIKTAKKNAFESTGYGILESTKLYYSKQVGELESDLTFTCNNDTCTSGEEKLEFKGNINGSGTVLLFKDGNIALCLESSDYATVKNINDERLSTTEQGTCEFNDETKEYAVIGTVSARDYEELQNQYNELLENYNNDKNLVISSFSNKGLDVEENSSISAAVDNFNSLPVSFGKYENGDYGYIINGEEELTSFTDKGKKVIYLGTGTSWNIKQMYPDLYSSLTISNFIVGVSRINQSDFLRNYDTGNWWQYVIGPGSISRSYNSSTGILTGSISVSLTGYHGTWDGVPYGFGGTTGTCEAYLVY